MLPLRVQGGGGRGIGPQQKAQKAPGRPRSILSLLRAEGFSAHPMQEGTKTHRHKESSIPQQIFDNMG
eukprot:5187328-Pyramimonas_sp.AAC.1